MEVLPHSSHTHGFVAGVLVQSRLSQVALSLWCSLTPYLARSRKIAVANVHAEVGDDCDAAEVLSRTREALVNLRCISFTFGDFNCDFELGDRISKNGFCHVLCSTERSALTPRIDRRVDKVCILGIHPEVQ
eukprot:1500009-Amphidinium_carterae.3